MVADTAHFSGSNGRAYRWVRTGADGWRAELGSVTYLMRRIGRVNGFSTGTLIGILGALICGFAVYSHSFWTLCAGTLVMGIYNASGQYYRFAAADVASPDFKSKAISLVMAGGLVGLSRG